VLLGDPRPTRGGKCCRRAHEGWGIKRIPSVPSTAWPGLYELNLNRAMQSAVAFAHSRLGIRSVVRAATVPGVGPFINGRCALIVAARAAAAVSQNHVVGEYGSLNTPTVNVGLNVFLAGARAYGEDSGEHVRILGWDGSRGTWADNDSGKQTATGGGFTGGLCTGTIANGGVSLASFRRGAESAHRKTADAPDGAQPRMGFHEPGSLRSGGKTGNGNG
jgi:hypothetical protein